MMNTCNILTTTVDLSHDKWLEFRQQGIGGSDASAILGYNKYKSPYMLYMEKLGLYNQDLSDNECVYWGNVLEDIVAKEFEKRTGKKVRRKNAVLQNEQYPIMLANIDREIVGENSILECKTTNAYLLKEWDGEEVPAGYILQCQHYMAVTGADITYIACLIGGNKFVYKEIKRDDELISILIYKEQEFWDMIQNKTPPAFNGCDGEVKYIKEQYSNSNDTCIDISNNMKRYIDKLLDLKEAQKHLKEEVEKYQNEIKNEMKNNEMAQSEKYTITWKNVVTNRYAINAALDFPKSFFYKVDNVENDVKIGYKYDGEKFIPTIPIEEILTEDVTTLKQQNIDTQLALTEIYETMLQGGVN